MQLSQAHLIVEFTQHFVLILYQINNNRPQNKNRTSPILGGEFDQQNDRNRGHYYGKYGKGSGYLCASNFYISIFYANFSML